MEEIPLSALQHFAFCPRQCALIHLEQCWQESVDTIDGVLLHERVHSGLARMRAGVRLETDLHLHCLRLGICGRSDLVEFHRKDGLWVPFPVEYKKGRPHPGHDADQIQLCAQALCLEEMLEISVPEGALFYGEVQHRQSVLFDSGLRARVENVIREVRTLFDSQQLPQAIVSRKCQRCSLRQMCMPEIFAKDALAFVKGLCQEDE